MLDDRTSETGDLQLHSIAHGVVSLEQAPREFGSERRRLRIVKMRGIKFRGGYHDFVLETGGILVVPAPDRGRAPRRLRRDGALDRLGRARPAARRRPGARHQHAAARALRASARPPRRSAACWPPWSAASGRPTTCSTRASRPCWRASATLGMDLSPHIDGRAPDDHADRPGRALARASSPAWSAQAVEERGSSFVVIDSLNAYLHAMPGEEYLILQMHEMLSYLNQQGVTTLLVLGQHGVIGEVRTDIDLSYLSDCILLFRFFEAKGEVRTALSVVKSRVNAHERTIREMRLVGAAGIQVGEASTDFEGVLTGLPSYRGKVAMLTATRPPRPRTDDGSAQRRDARPDPGAARARRRGDRAGARPGRHAGRNLPRPRRLARRPPGRAPARRSSPRRRWARPSPPALFAWLEAQPRLVGFPVHRAGDAPGRAPLPARVASCSPGSATWSCWSARSTPRRWPARGLGAAGAAPPIPGARASPERERGRRSSSGSPTRRLERRVAERTREVEAAHETLAFALDAAGMGSGTSIYGTGTSRRSPRFDADVRLRRAAAALGPARPSWPTSSRRTGRASTGVRRRRSRPAGSTWNAGSARVDGAVRWIALRGQVKYDAAGTPDPDRRHPDGPHRPARHRGGPAPGAEDGGDRPAHRRRRPRLQQPAHRHRRRPRHDAPPARAGRPGQAPRRGRDGRGPARRAADPAAPRLLPPADAAAADAQPEPPAPGLPAARGAGRRRARSSSPSTSTRRSTRSASTRHSSRPRCST